MPRYSQPQKNKLKNGSVKKNEEAPKRRNSMPDLLAMGNEALQNSLAHNQSMILPLAPGNEAANQSLNDSFLVIEPDDDGYEGDSEHEDPNESVIDTSRKKKPKVELKLPHQQPKEIDNPQEAQEAVQDSEDEDSDLDQIDGDMRPAAGFDFQPQPMEPQKKISGWSKFVNFATSFFGVVVGKTLGTIINLGLLPITAPIIAGAYSRSDALEGVMQKKRRHDYIPGWDGAKFDPKKTEGKDIMADFRRVPTVWSYLTADQAEESRGDPKDPEITVYVHQPVSGSSQAMEGTEMGHTTLGIEYSRYSQISDRYERYDLRYGFYPGGKFSTTVSSGMVMLNKNAIVPGQLVDDRNHHYTVSRKFKAKPDQVNAIFKASETYADKGYGYYNRNCATFVKNMVVDVAHIPGADALFKKEEVDFSAKANVGVFGSLGFNINAKAGMENQMMDLAQRVDESYQGYGNLRVTHEDYKNYKESIQNDTFTKKTYLPGAIGESIRRLNGKNAGEIGAMDFADESMYGIDLHSLTDRIETSGDNLSQQIKALLQDKMRNGENIPEDLVAMVTELPWSGSPIMDLEMAINSGARAKGLDPETAGIKDLVKPDDVRTARQKISGNIRKINLLLNGYFKNDKRIHGAAMNLISLLNLAVRQMDFLYRNTARGADVGGDLGDIRSGMTQNAIKISAGGKSCPFTPTHYESYLQIYKTPEKAVDAYSRFLEIEQKNKNGEELSSAEKQEFSKLRRMEDTANQYDNSHNYLLEKEDFSMQDIQYIYNLRNKEQKNANSVDFSTGKTSAGIYQSLLFEKVFNGMKERFDTNEDFYDMKLNDHADMQKLEEWLDKDLTQCAAKKYKELLMIIDGMQLAMDPQADEDDIFEQFYDDLSTNWLEKVFVPRRAAEKLEIAYVDAAMTFARIFQNENGSFHKVVKNIIKLIKLNQKKSDIRH